MSDFKDAFDAGQESTRWQRPTIPAAYQDRAIVLTDAAGNERIEYFPLERLRDLPLSKRGTATFYATDSFIRYVAEQRQPGTRIYITRSTQSIVAVIDGHAPDTPGWGRHRATLVTQPTRVWQEWMQFSADYHEQVPFAHFIESHITEIATPNGADLLEMVSALEIHVNATFSSAVRLQSGMVQLTYHEQVDGNGLKHQTTIPDRLSLVMVPFEGGTPVLVEARLRYRLREGQLRLRVELHRPQETLEGAFDQRVNVMTDQADKLDLGTLIFAGDAPPELKPQA